jgi:hypothetical protein
MEYIVTASAVDYEVDYDKLVSLVKTKMAEDRTQWLSAPSADDAACLVMCLLAISLMLSMLFAPLETIDVCLSCSHARPTNFKPWTFACRAALQDRQTSNQQYQRQFSFNTATVPAHPVY